MAQYAYVYVNHTHLQNWSASSCYLTTAVLNDCYSEETAYTSLPYTDWASFHNAYGCLRHTHYRYRPQLPYKSHRTYLTNHMESISRHIMPLVIHSLGGGHTHTQTHIQTFANRSNSKKSGVRAWFKKGRSIPTMNQSKQNQVSMLIIQLLGHIIFIL